MYAYDNSLGKGEGIDNSAAIFVALCLYVCVEIQLKSSADDVF